MDRINDRLNDCDDNCVVYHHAGGIYHRHCALCNAMVAVGQSGPASHEVDVNPAWGEVCHGEVVCVDCMTTLTPDGSRMCSACAMNAVRDFFQRDLGMAASDVQSALTRFSDLFGNETNPVTLGEIVVDLEQWMQKLQDIRAEVDGKIQAAYRQGAA